MAAYTSTQSGDFNDPNTWGGSGWPSANGDTFTVSSGHTVYVNLDHSSVVLGMSTVYGTLSAKPGTTGKLSFSAVLVFKNGSTLAAGSPGSPFSAPYEFAILWGAGDTTAYTLISFQDGCTVGLYGDWQYNQAGDGFEYQWCPLLDTASAGTNTIKVPYEFAAALRSSGDVLWIEGTGGKHQGERVTVSSVTLPSSSSSSSFSSSSSSIWSGREATLTLSSNLTYNHDTGAVVALLSRNIIIGGTTGYCRHFVNSNASPEQVIFDHVYFENYYRMNGTSNRKSTIFNGCAFSGDIGYGIDTCSMYMTNCIVTSTSSSTILLYRVYGGSYLQNVYLFGGNAATRYYAFKGDNILFSGMTQGLYQLQGVCLDNIEVRYCDHGIYDSSAMTTACIRNGYFHDNANADILLAGGCIELRYCKLASSIDVLTSIEYGQGEVRSHDHNQVIGASKMWKSGLGTIEKQSTVTRSGTYAVEMTPDTYISEEDPLTFEWEIACQHGDTIYAEVWVRVNSAYGTGNDPTLELDPNNIYGCNDTNSESIAATDTWTKFSVSGTADTGGAGVKATVNLRFSVPHYAVGAKVYVDDLRIEIT